MATARKRTATKPAPQTTAARYETLLTGFIELLETARRAAARSVNTIMTATYWLIGQRLVEHEQLGSERASYGVEVVERLSGDLSARYGRGFSRSNLFQMRAFYVAYRNIVQTTSGQSANPHSIRELAGRLSLPWSHYVRLLSLRTDEARRFY